MNNKILIVDDDLDLQDIIKSALEIEGYPVVLANNGKEALSMLEINNGICCIILDMMMPIMDGKDTLKALRSNPKWKNIPVIISTAKGSVDKDIEDNSQAVIKKPLKIENLYDTVGKFSKNEQ